MGKKEKGESAGKLDTEKKGKRKSEEKRKRVVKEEGGRPRT